MQRWGKESTVQNRDRNVDDECMPDRFLKLRYRASCSGCQTPMAPGSPGWWNSENRTASCETCHAADSGRPPAVPPIAVPELSETLPTTPPTSTAGASAKLIYERKHERRAAQIEQRWGRLSGVVKFLSDDPQSTKAWAKGSEGERKLADHLLRTVGDRAVMLHDRRIPGSRANIDHLIVAASGIWVVDAKSYKGKVEHRDVGGWFKTDDRLYVNGREQTKLVGGLAKQIDAVLGAIEHADVSIRAALCFVDSEWGLFAKPFQLGGVFVTWPRKLSEMISEPGPLGRNEVMQLAGRLAASLPAAV